MGFELGSLHVFCRLFRCDRRKLPICSLKMCLWRDPGKSLENIFFLTTCCSPSKRDAATSIGFSLSP